MFVALSVCMGAMFDFYLWFASRLAPEARVIQHVFNFGSVGSSAHSVIGISVSLNSTVLLPGGGQAAGMLAGGRAAG